MSIGVEHGLEHSCDEDVHPDTLLRYTTAGSASLGKHRAYLVARRTERDDKGCRRLANLREAKK
ncbi:MAG TPA: hypothetical protein VGE76_05750, partial [Opitutaceae bacterium]